MKITEAITARYNSVLSDIPNVVCERLTYLQTNRIGSAFDKHGAVIHIIDLGKSQVEKVAVGLLRATYANPYLTDQEKLECLMEDGPEIYAMEACIELAEVYELQLERLNERKAYDKECLKTRNDLKRLVLASSFATFLNSALEWVSPTSVHDAVMQAKQKAVVMENPSISSFIDSLTVDILKQRMAEVIQHSEKNGNLNILSVTPQKIMEGVMSGIVKDCQHKAGRAVGIGAPVHDRPNRSKYYTSKFSPSHSS